MSTVVLQNVATTPSAPLSERKTYWVQPRLQAKFVGWLVAISAIVATTVAWAILLVVWAPLGHQLVWAGPGADANKLFWDACLRVFLTTGLLVVIFGLVAFLSGIIISHRVAGPLHRIGLVATQVSQGQYHERVTLRHGDYVQEFAVKINEMLDHVDSRMSQQQRTLTQAYNKLSDLEMAISDGTLSPEDVEKRLQDTLHLLREARIHELADETSCT